MGKRLKVGCERKKLSRIGAQGGEMTSNKGKEFEMGIGRWEADRQQMVAGGVNSPGEGMRQGSFPEWRVHKLHCVKKHLLLTWKGGRM